MSKIGRSSTMVIDKEDLKEFLEFEFHSTIRRRGKSLFFSDHVQNVIFSNQEISAEVTGSDLQKLYRVHFYFQKKRIISSSCTCPYDDACKHEAALSYYLLNTSEKLLSKQGKGPFGDSLRKMQNANEFRELPKIPKHSPMDLIKRLKPHIPYWLDRLRTEHWMQSETEITSKIFEDGWGGGSNVYGEVTIRKEKGRVMVKCNSCVERSKKLCPHQYLALANLHDSELGNIWYNKELDFEKVYAMIAEDHSISKENLVSAFDLSIIGDHFAIRPKAKGLVLGMDKSKIREMVRHQMNIQATSTEKMLSALERKGKFQNGMVWENWSDEELASAFRIIEGKSDKGRTKLNAYIKEVDYPTYFNADQRHLYQSLNSGQQAIMGGEESGRRSIHKILQENIPLIKSIHQYYLDEDSIRTYYHTEVRKKDLRQFHFRDERARVRFRAYIEHDLFVFEVRIFIGGKEGHFESVVFFNGHFLCADDGMAYLYGNPDDGEAIKFFKDNPKLLFFPSDRTSFFTFLEEIGKKYPVDIDIPSISTVKIQQAKRKVYLKEVESYVAFEPILEYRRTKINALQPQRIHGRKDSLKIFDIDEDLVHRFINDLEGMHPDWVQRRKGHVYYLSGEELIRNWWFLDFFDRCKALDIEVYGQENLKNFNYNTHRATVSSQIKSGIDWFDVNIDISYGDQKVSTKDWLEAIKNNTPFVKLGDGSIGILPTEWLERLKRVQKSATYRKDELKIDKLKFNLVDQLFDDMDIDAQILEEIAERKEKLKSFTENRAYKLPKNVQATLRDYQVGGYRWLKFLQEFGFGGCLADDMGLGKTLQAICVLADHHANHADTTSLVVAPRTLLFNWASEIDKFCPTLTYVIHHGPSRNRDVQDLASYDVVISTYDTVTSDIELMRGKTWAYAILDESQAIKNPGSKRYKAMRLLKSQYRLVMTGTPIENSTFDLFAQMNFANPGLLGNMTSFKRDFVLPIEKHQEEASASLLQKTIHPFVLRRTKEQVAKDLPEKTESILYCEMEKPQREQYDELKHQIRESIMKKVSKSSVAQSKFIILEGLLRLRQMCNAPQLVDPAVEGKKQDSIKLNTLVDQLTGEVGNHNALVFSQFVGMLKLIRERLEALQIPYLYLDGSTRDRQKVVQTFEQSEAHRIFLISLKAGNTGLNLVKADYVYIVDPWWNPAVEAQAIDRTHRIGQDKHIFAYKLICKDSVEEKILDLQKKKKKLASDIIHTDASIMKSLTKEDLLGLFE